MRSLVGDRRILVDFSQSVSKFWDKYHQKMRLVAVRMYISHRNGRRDGRMTDRNRKNLDEKMIIVRRVKVEMSNTGEMIMH